MKLNLIFLLQCIALLVLLGLVAANAQIAIPNTFLNPYSYSPLAYRGWAGPMMTSAALLNNPYGVRYAYNTPYAYNAYNGLRSVYPGVASVYSPLVVNSGVAK